MVKGEFSEERAKFYAIQLAMAIGHLHKKSIIHRDLKPENVLMGDDGYILITDFGIAAKLKEDEKLKQIMGSNHY